MSHLKFLLLIISVYGFTVLPAQHKTKSNTEKISYKAFAYREPTKAVYLTFEDFKYNRPTERPDIAMVGENLAYWNTDADRYSKFTSPFWGAIIDSVLYVKMGIHTYPLEVLGKYSMITENYLPVYNNRNTRMVDHIVNLENGRITKMSKGNMIEILHKEAPQLVNPFKDEYDKFMYCPKYLIMINELYEP